MHPISRPAVSKHLRVLVDAGLVRAERHGRERHYALEPGGLDPVDALLRDLRPQPRFGEAVLERLDGLDLEVRRTVRDHRAATTPDPEEETA